MNKKSVTAGFLLVLLLSISVHAQSPRGISPPPLAPPTLEDRVRAALFNCIAVFNQALIEPFADCLAEDVTLFNPDIPDAPDLHRLDGRSAVVAHFRRMFDSARQRREAPPYFDVKPQNVAVQVLGETAAVATFEFSREGGTLGRRTFVFAQRDDRWQAVHIHASNTADRGPVH